MGDYVFRKEYNHNMFTFLEVNCRKTSRQEVYKHWARRAEMDAHNGRALYTSFTNTISWGSWESWDVGGTGREKGGGQGH